MLAVSGDLYAIVVQVLNTFWISGNGKAVVFNKSQVNAGDTRHCSLCWVYGDCNDDVSSSLYSLYYCYFDSKFLQVTDNFLSGRCL
jgi:hypothetical protein